MATTSWFPLNVIFAFSSNCMDANRFPTLRRIIFLLHVCGGLCWTPFGVELEPRSSQMPPKSEKDCASRRGWVWMDLTYAQGRSRQEIIVDMKSLSRWLCHLSVRGDIQTPTNSGTQFVNSDRVTLIRLERLGRQIRTFYRLPMTRARVTSGLHRTHVDRCGSNVSCWGVRKEWARIGDPIRPLVWPWFMNCCGVASRERGCRRHQLGVTNGYLLEGTFVFVLCSLFEAQRGSWLI